MSENIKKLIAKSLGIDESMIVEKASFTNDLGADSLDLFELIMELEEEFQIEIPEEELQHIDTVGDLLKYIEKKDILDEQED